MTYPGGTWKAEALAALDSDAVWGIYIDAVYQPVERIVLEGNKTLVDGKFTRDGQARQVPSIADPVPLLLDRLWQRGQRYAALSLITGLWLRVRQTQEHRHQIPWPVDDLLDGLRFYLQGTEWTDTDHREFSEMFWTRIAEPTIADNLTELFGEE